jgi:SAM-dependent MidA family methyltransferase
MNGPAPLAARIAELIAVQGPISVAQYMTLALHDAQSGYYATRDPLGADFITAPEISQMFGEMLGLWCVQVWEDQGRPQNLRLVELGPGRGTLMADMLRAMKQAPDMKVDVVMVEASPVLQAIQRRTLRDSGASIVWKTHFDEELADRPLLLVANEFFDALPIRQYAKTQRGWCERMVVEKDSALSFALAPSALPPSAIPPERAAAPDGGIYETSPASTALAEEIARIVAVKGGGALILDYGYSGPGGFGETLQAVKANAFADVLADPGSHDLSAHVDFAAMAEAGRRGGAIVHGPRGQGEFLVRLGLARRAEQLMKANPAKAKSIYAALERLIHPAQMGTLFKALAFLPPPAGPAPGF